MKTNLARRLALLLALSLPALPGRLAAETPTLGASQSGESMLRDYFKEETRLITEDCLTELPTLEQWKAKREALRAQLFEMLSLSPLPERTPLNAVTTGKEENSEVIVEKLHFQSRPGLYVTGNLFLPKERAKPLPAVLYVCGHSPMKKNGVSYGNKTGYDHHGAWFARNGFVCLVIDSVQLGEIEGIHHGTYREKMWWWNSRGYTSAGAEAWNSIRALDYLQSRPEVDGSRLGVTGRSGGGAYSWWLSALDERVKVAAPVAGITDMQDQVVGGVVEGHCDCMFTVNTYRWDFPLVAALVAPRPLLICNSDKDSIFPLDGVVRLHKKVAQIYKLYGATNNLGLLITDGPHSDTQDLQLPVFRWFNRHLKGEDPVITLAATHQFQPEQLKVFGALPQNERTSKIYETFVPVFSPGATTASDTERRQQQAALRETLLEKVFHGWPQNPVGPTPHLGFTLEQKDATLSAYEYDSQTSVRLRLFVLGQSKGKANRATARVLSETEWPAWARLLEEQFPSLVKSPAGTNGAGVDASLLEAAGRELREALAAGEALVLVAPRGVGPSGWVADERKQTQIRRRFMLLGQTLDSMRVWDLRQAIRSIPSLQPTAGLPVSLRASGEMAVNALYAAVFEPSVRQLDLRALPSSHRQGPDYLNVLRFTDIPQVLALARENAQVKLD